MTVKGFMEKTSRRIIAHHGKKKLDLFDSEALAIQGEAKKETGLYVDDRDIKIFYREYAAAYWKTHKKKPMIREATA